MFEEVTILALLTLLFIFHLRFVDNLKKTLKIEVVLLCSFTFYSHKVEGSSEF